MVVVSEKPWFAPCYRTFHLLKMCKKFRFSWILKFLFGSWDLALAWLIYCFSNKQGKPSIWRILKNILKTICQIPIAKLGKCFPFRDGFYAFFGSFGGDIFWNWSIRIWKMVSTFPLWQFSRASFFAQKNITKKIMFLCFQDTECNSTQTEINFQFLSQEEYPFDPCTYRGFLFLHFSLFFKILCFQDTICNYTQNAENFIFFGSWQWFSAFLVSGCAM